MTRWIANVYHCSEEPVYMSASRVKSVQITGERFDWLVPSIRFQDSAIRERKIAIARLFIIYKQIFLLLRRRQVRREVRCKNV